MISHDILGEWWEKTVIHHDIPWYTMIYHWTLDDFRNPSFETPFHSSPQRYPANSLGKPWQGQQHGLGFAWEKAHEIGFLHYHAISCPKKLQLALFWYQPQLQPDCDPLSLSFLSHSFDPFKIYKLKIHWGWAPWSVEPCWATHSPSPWVLRTTALFPSPFLRGA